ncbi:MAG TPA: hypothetical protein PLU33_09020 [Treponemataceae bacterium]|nr:hypothetical protein [Treponemataceae bacterium]HQL05271.1 hypothetical protein [Treponemataceae bacterium]
MTGFVEVSQNEMMVVDGGGPVTDILTGIAAGCGICASFPTPAAPFMGVAAAITGVAAYICSQYDL